MMDRCKVGGAYQIIRPSYVGCSVSDSFKDFQLFTEWYRGQVGYGVEDYALDKDILCRDNRVYSEDTCAVIPRGLNQFLVSRKALRGAYKVGVRGSRGRYRAQISDNAGGQRYLGSFESEEAAYQAYKVAKEAEAYRWYERLATGEFVIDPRITERMRTWKLEEDND
jgi:hypothetical protein